MDSGNLHCSIATTPAKLLACWIRVKLAEKLAKLIIAKKEGAHMPWSLEPRIEKLTRSLSDLSDALSDEEDDI